jgi:hypothetical protein
MTTMRGRSDAVLEATGKGQTSMDATAIMIPPRSTATVTIENATVMAETHFRATCTCRVGRSASWFVTAIANTPYVAPNRARWRPLDRSEWSPVVTFATTMGARLIHAPATYATCANKG